MRQLKLQSGREMKSLINELKRHTLSGWDMKREIHKN